MQRDFTLFAFDLDESAVRRVLSAIPGVTPLPSADDEADAQDRPARASEPASARRTPPTVPSTDTGLTGTQIGGRDDFAGEPDPSLNGESDVPGSPWPGAPSTGDADESASSEWSGKRALVAVALVTGLGLLGVAVVRTLRRRRDDESDTDGDAPDGGADDAGEQADDVSRASTFDASPIVGMSILAVLAVVVRYLRSRGE